LERSSPGATITLPSARSSECFSAMGRIGTSRGGRKRLVCHGVWQRMVVGLANLRSALVRAEPRDRSGLWLGCVLPIAQKISPVGVASFQSSSIRVSRSITSATEPSVGSAIGNAELRTRDSVVVAKRHDGTETVRHVSPLRNWITKPAFIWVWDCSF